MNDRSRHHPYPGDRHDAGATAAQRRRVDRYPDYAALAAAEREGVDYRVRVRETSGGRVAIVAPHAGGIERGTGPIAAGLAGDAFSLYLFEGLKPGGNFDTLHLTSRRFDEPRCLDLVSRHETVITVHGCVGRDEFVCVGGLHEEWKLQIAAVLCGAGFDARVGNHNFPATDPDNLCNRGRGGRGIQLEFSAGFRRRMQYDGLTHALQRFLRGD